MPSTNCKSTGTCDSFVEQRLRRKYKVATIGSILARRQLLFWRKLLRPWVVDDGRHDTSLMPRLVCLGLLSFEEESDEPRLTARMQLFSKDLILPREALKDCAGGMQSGFSNRRTQSMLSSRYARLQRNRPQQDLRTIGSSGWLPLVTLPSARS